MSEQRAEREWHTRAIVRILETVHAGTPEGGRRTFRAGEELEMVQWGRAGRPVTRDAWWTSFDIDGAFIIKASKVEVIKYLDEVLPQERMEQQ